MEKRQRDTLARLGEILGHDELYLAGGTAVAFHLKHRVSRHLDLFTTQADTDLELLRQKIAHAVQAIEVLSQSKTSMRMRLDGELVDFVRYPYALLEVPTAGPGATSGICARKCCNAARWHSTRR